MDEGKRHSRRGFYRLQRGAPVGKHLHRDGLPPFCRRGSGKVYRVNAAFNYFADVMISVLTSGDDKWWASFICRVVCCHVPRVAYPSSFSLALKKAWLKY